MNNTTKILIAGGAGLGAFFLYKFIKKKMDEKNAKGEKSKELDEKLKEVEEKKDDGILDAKKSSAPQSKPKQEPSAYEKKVMMLQELLKVGVDGSAGKQTLGQLEYMWADYGLPLNPEQSAKDGYPNLKKNGKGVLSASNIDYYIDTLKASKSPRSLYWGKGGSSSGASASKSTETLSKDLLAKLSKGGRGRLKLKKDYTAPEMVLSSQNSYTTTTGKRSWSVGTSFFKGDFLEYPRVGTGNLLYVRGNYIYEIPPQNFEFLNY
jgi:hypothetical protein